MYIFVTPIDSVAQLVNAISLDNRLGTVTLTDIFNKSEHQLGTQKLDQIAFQPRDSHRSILHSSFNTLPPTPSLTRRTGQIKDRYGKERQTEAASV